MQGDPLPFYQLARKYQGVVIKFIDSVLVAVAEKILCDHGDSLHKSYHLHKMDNVSLRETLDAGILHSKRVSVDRRVLRAALCMTDGAAVAHKRLLSAKTHMSSLRCSGGEFVLSASYTDDYLPLVSGAY